MRLEYATSEKKKNKCSPWQSMHCFRDDLEKYIVVSLWEGKQQRMVSYTPHSLLGHIYSQSPPPFHVLKSEGLCREESQLVSKANLRRERWTRWNFPKIGADEDGENDGMVWKNGQMRWEMMRSLYLEAGRSKQSASKSSPSTSWGGSRGPQEKNRVRKRLRATVLNKYWTPCLVQRLDVALKVIFLFYLKPCDLQSYS